MELMDRNRRNDEVSTEGPPIAEPLPALVQLIAWLSFVWAALVIVAAIALWQSLSNGESRIEFLILEFDGRRSAFIFLAVAVVEALFALVIGFGLLRRSEVARVVAVAGYAFNALFLLATTLAEPVTGAVMLGVLVSIGLAVYLSQPAVRDHFV